MSQFKEDVTLLAELDALIRKKTSAAAPDEGTSELAGMLGFGGLLKLSAKVTQGELGVLQRTKARLEELMEKEHGHDE